jgi:uncharacterized protein YkwD
MGLVRALLLVLPLALAACAPPPPSVGSDGLPLPTVYTIREADKARIQFGMLDSVNVLRQAAGRPALALNAELTAAAATHARDMAVQNRPWHFGSDGSSPLERTARAGYPGQFRGELISETYETEIETLAAWMQSENTRNMLLDPEARDMGFSWFQESSGKLWWTMVLGGAGPQIVPDV